MKKDIKFSTRMASADREKIRALAQKAGMSMSDYVTACCLGKRIVVMDGLKEVLRQQKAIGNNLNQLAVLANTGKVQFANLDAAAQEFAKINVTLRQIQEGGRENRNRPFRELQERHTVTRLHEKRDAVCVAGEQDDLGWSAARQRNRLSAGNGVRRISEYEAAAPQRRRRDVLPHGAEFPEGCGR